MTVEDEEGAEHLSAVDRIAFFSDSVFAIAMTLLVLGLRVPSGVPAADLRSTLASLRPQYFGFGLSFVVIAIFWMGHHSRFESLRGATVGLMWVNTLQLIAIVFLPFPTQLIGRYSQSTTAAVFYASSMAFTGGTWIMNSWYCAHAGLLKPDYDRRRARGVLIRAAAFVGVFAVSIPVAFASVSAAETIWIAYFPVGLALTFRWHR